MNASTVVFPDPHGPYSAITNPSVGAKLQMLSARRLAKGELAVLRGLTSKVRLGTSVMVAPLRNPVQLAKSLSSLDQMSLGRLTVGLGLGGGTGDYPPFGIDPARRVRRFVEVVEVMKALWTQSAADYQGQLWQLDGIHMEPKPVQQPHPPIWFGGSHPAALRRAVRHGNGWMGAGSSSTS